MQKVDRFLLLINLYGNNLNIISNKYYNNYNHKKYDNKVTKELITLLNLFIKYDLFNKPLDKLL